MKKTRGIIRGRGDEADAPISYYQGLLDDLHDHHVEAHRHIDLDNLFLGFRDRSGSFSDSRDRMKPPPTAI